MHWKKASVFLVFGLLVLVSAYFLLSPREMIVSDSLGWEGYFEEYDCFGREVVNCPEPIGHSLCRDYQCVGLLTNKRCYVQTFSDDESGDRRVIKEDVVCK